MANYEEKRVKGIITKKSGEKTYKVTISKRIPHPLYRKIVTREVSFLAHGENEHEIGETVFIIPVTKISKKKYYRIIEETKMK